MNQKITQILADAIAIYAYRLRLSQADLPYVVQQTARPASTKAFAAYADQLTIQGDLINPGQAINIVARVIELQQAAMIDTSGAEPDHSFLPGQLPVQENSAFGAAGADGADASKPGDAGAITFAAGSIVLSGSSMASTTVAPIQAWIEQLLANAVVQSQIATALENLPFPFQLQSDDLPIAGVLDISGAIMRGAQSYTLKAATLDSGTRDWFVDLEFQNLSLDGTINASLAGVSVVVGAPLSTPPFALSLRLRIAHSAPVLTPTLGQRVAISDNLVLSIAGETLTLSASSRALFANACLSALGGKLLPIIAACIESNPATLTLLAQGGTGGRGQDGQNGIAGKPGTNGFTPANSPPGLVQNGILISYPAEAAGSAGTPGGQAGSAGHSTPAGAAAEVSLTLGGGGIEQLVVSASAGRGGDRAMPGASGAGGAGGVGSDILVAFAGDPNGVVHDWRAPDGADGAPGAAPNYAGADAPDGAPGTLLLNGAPLQGLSQITANAGALAMSVPLTQLLICDQCNAVEHLNAQSSSELSAVVARYVWMVSITEAFTNGADPSHGTLSANDLAVRRAINQSAKLELARLAKGLDYYGNIVNWVPVLSMTALQGRVADLLALGKIVEDTFNTYFDANSTATTRLSVLDRTLEDLRGKITADQALIAQMDTELNLAETEVKASLAPIAAQQNRLVEDEYEFKEQFIAYVLSQATACSFVRVLELIVCVVEFAAEAVVGLEEISALTEAETIGGFAAGVVKVIKTAEAEIEAIRKAVESVQSLLDTDIDMAKIVVDEKNFDAFIDQYLGKFPAAQELADAVHQYFALIQAHNKLALAYTGLALRQARLKVAVLKRQSQVEVVAALRAQIAADTVLPEYTAFMTSAYWDLKADLLRELFEFNRAYTYWSLVERPFLASDETIANLAITYASWSADIDAFLQQTGPVQPFEQQIDITIADYPEAFALLARTRSLNVRLDLESLVPKYFANMTHIVATSLQVKLPDIHASSGVLLIELTHSGLAAQNSGDPRLPGKVHVFSHARRTIPYKIDYANPANTAGGVIGDRDQGFPGLSPFTLWQISFAQAGNEWLDVSQIRTISLVLSGTFLLADGAG